MWGGPLGGLSLRSAPAPGPPAPCSAPPLVRAGLLRSAARSALPAWRRVGRPSLGAPPAPVGASGLRGPSWAPSGCRAPGPPVGPSLGPLRCSSGAGSAPPLRPPWSGGRWGLPWAAGPPLGGLPWWFLRLWCRASSPPGVGRGLSPRRRAARYWWPLLLAPEDEERRRRAASRRSVSMSAIAYSAVTVLLSWFSARRTLSISPYFCIRSTA